jgi:UDPglucose 6-dehydrogenase
VTARPVVGFAGLTHLGLVSAVAIAARGFGTVAYDDDGKRVGEIAAGRMPVVEPDLDALARQSASQLRFTNRIEDLGACDLVYVATDVPTTDGGESDLSGISDLTERVVAALAPHALMVVLCQVPPGFTRRLPLPPERLFYQVETLVFGRAIERATKPERYIVGCADPASPIPVALRTVLEAFGCPILPMRYESAELAKIAINCCLVSSITVANTLADLSERIGADWSEIAPALKLDARIGPAAYLTPGLGIAGGNLERDLATVLRLAAATGADATLIDSFVSNSRYRRDWVLRMLHAEVLAHNSQALIGILGLSYKENTHSTKNSPALALISQLGPWRLRVYDPVVPASEVSHPRAVGAASPLAAAEGVDALAVMTPWAQFSRLDAADLAGVMAGRVVLDPYRVLNGRAMAKAGLDYLTIGALPLRATEAAHA